MPEEERWFGVRCLFRHDGGHFEERITLWRASSLTVAIRKAEAEAHDYVRDLKCEYLGFCQAFGPAMTRDYDEALELDEGSEVFSLIRDSDLESDEYIDRFFATGSERQHVAGSEESGATSH